MRSHEGVLWLLVAFAISQNVASADEESCNDIPPKKRIECGWRGISQGDCESRGCCFDSRFRRSLWCFKKPGTEIDTFETAIEKEPSVVRSCVVSPRDRVDCGWPRIKEEVCENRGCCYSEEYKNSFWCFHPKTIFTPPSVENIMKCVSKCLRTPWGHTVLAGASCQTNVNCWKLREGATGAACISLCKTKTSTTDFVGNLSSCLGLSPESQIQTKLQCNLNLNCWMKRYGKMSENCSEEYVRTLEGRVDTTVPKQLSQIGQIAKHPGPEIEMPPYFANIPPEPNQEDMEWLLEPDPNTTRTDINVEKAISPPVEDRTEEEEPNPWWEQESVRA